MRIDTRFNRYLLNGVIATAVHYTVLVTLIEGAHLQSAGLANGIASLFGTTASYLGNKMLVFQSDAPHRRTLPRFLMVYLVVALLHGGILVAWADIAGLPYRVGFLIAAVISVVLTYVSNKRLVFNAVPARPRAIEDL